MTEIKCSEDYSTIKDLFVEYSGIKGAEGCFVSFDKELADLKNFYSGGAILLGYEDDAPFGCIAIKKVDDNICEAKRLYIKPEFRGKGYGHKKRRLTVFVNPPKGTLLCKSRFSKNYIWLRRGRMTQDMGF